LQVWLVTQVVDFCPEERNASSHLHKAQAFAAVDSTSSCWLAVGREWIEEDNLFRLVEIRDVALDIDSSGEVSSSDAMSGPS